MIHVVAVRRPLTTLVVMLAMLLGLAVAVVAPPAEAVSISVTRTDDPVPGTPGQCGSPATNGSNDCSLRQAVRRANDLTGADMIVLPAGTYNLTRTDAVEDDDATVGDIDVTDDLTITGAGRTTTIIDGSGMAANTNRMFHVGAVRLTMSDLTLTKGSGSDLGGALFNEAGTVALTRINATENFITGDAGGALANINGTVTITDSEFSQNTADNYGGALFNFATDDVDPQTADMTITGSTIRDNTSTFKGGGIATEAEGSSTANLTVDMSTLTGNTALDCCGGAIIADDSEFGFGGDDARTNVIIRDSNLDGNFGVNCCGGAIYAEGTFGADEYTVTVLIERSSLDGNSSEGADPGDGCCGGAVYLQYASLEATDTSFDENVDDNCCGGAMYIDRSTADFTRVTMNDNLSFIEEIVDFNGACCGGAAGIYNSTVTFTDSEIRGNVTGVDCCGGAFEIGNTSDVTFLRTTIADNESSGCCGGAIEMYGGSTVRVIDSTFSDNRETTGFDDGNLNDGGGAIAMYDNGDLLEIVNSTISGNSTEETGGGIMANRGTVSIVHSTITGNTAAVDGSALALGDTTDDFDIATATIVNSIIDGTCTVSEVSTLTSGGGNVATDSSCELDDASDQTVADAMLGDLADNGGPTLTHALLPGSPALDAGTADTLEPVNADQRGVERAQEGDGVAPAEADAGSVEMAYADLSLTKTVDDATPTEGDQLTYTLTATNAGPAAAPVQIVDVLPAGVTFVSASAGCTIDTGVVTCDDGGSLAAGASRASTITVTADAVGTITNTGTAVLATATYEDLDGSDNEDDVTITVAEAPVVVPAPAQRDLPGGVRRLAGENRLLTAVEISKQTYDAGTAGAVVLARSDAFPDALAGTPLAIQENAPLLLTPPGALAAETAAELTRVLASGGTVYLLGGDVALSPAVDAAVKALGFTTVRYAGATRYDTAVTIATDGLDGISTVFLVTGRNFPDAVAAGAATGPTDGAILLTEDTVMPAATATYLASVPSTTPVFAVGGPAAAAQAGDTDLIGADRLATSLLVANRFFDDPPVAGVATGYNFPDALTGGAQLGVYGGPMLLSRQELLPDTIAAYLRSLPADATVFLYGGPVALSLDVETAITAARAR